MYLVSLGTAAVIHWYTLCMGMVNRGTFGKSSLGIADETRYLCRCLFQCLASLYGDSLSIHSQKLLGCNQIACLNFVGCCRFPLNIGHVYRDSADMEHHSLVTACDQTRMTSSRFSFLCAAASLLYGTEMPSRAIR